MPNSQLPNRARQLHSGGPGKSPVNDGIANMNELATVLEVALSGNRNSGNDFRCVNDDTANVVAVRRQIGSTPNDAHSSSITDDDLGPWIAMPDGGLEWRGW